MTHSHGADVPLTCPDCAGTFTAQIWLIVDAQERTDLLDRARDGTLHDVTCPHCGESRTVDAPLLIFNAVARTRGGADTPALIFSPASQTSVEEDREQAAGLLGILRQELGDAWRDEWVAEMPTVPRGLLPAALSDDPEAAWAQMQADMEAALERLRQEDPETFAQLEEAARQALAGDDTVGADPRARTRPTTTMMAGRHGGLPLRMTRPHPTHQRLPPRAGEGWEGVTFPSPSRRSWTNWQRRASRSTTKTTCNGRLPNARTFRSGSWPPYRPGCPPSSTP